MSVGPYVPGQSSEEPRRSIGFALKGCAAGSSGTRLWLAELGRVAMGEHCFEGSIERGA